MVALCGLSGASDEARASLGLVSDRGAYRMLQPQESHKLLQKAFLKERNKESFQSHRGGDAHEEEQVPKAVDQVRQ